MYTLLRPFYLIGILFLCLRAQNQYFFCVSQNMVCELGECEYRFDSCSLSSRYPPTILSLKVYVYNN